jgi:hypothetical protein
MAFIARRLNGDRGHRQRIAIRVGKDTCLVEGRQHTASKIGKQVIGLGHGGSLQIGGMVVHEAPTYGA